MSQGFVNLGALSLKQASILIPERQKGGLHQFFTNGWDISDNSKLYTELPGLMINESVFTVLFYNKQPAQRNSNGFRLCHVEKELRDLLSVSLGGKWTGQYIIDNQDQGKGLETTVPVKGFHVLQFQATAASLEVLLDSQLCIKSGAVTQEFHKYIKFSENDFKDKPFVVWEMHFTMADITTGFSPHHGIRYCSNQKIGMGGYATFYGEWTAPASVQVKTDNIDYGTVTQAQGTETITVRVYKDGYAVISGTQSKETPLSKTHSKIVLTTLRVEPKPDKLLDIRVVMGETFM